MTVGLLALMAVVLPPQPSVLILPLPMIAILIGATRTIGVVTALLPELRWTARRPAKTRRSRICRGWMGVCRRRCLVSNRTDGYRDGASHALRGTRFRPIPTLSYGAVGVCNEPRDCNPVWYRSPSGKPHDASLRGRIALRRRPDLSYVLCIHLLDLTPATEGQAASWLPLAISSSLGSFVDLSRRIFIGERAAGTR